MYTCLFDMWLCTYVLLLHHMLTYHPCVAITNVVYNFVSVCRLRKIDIVFVFDTSISIKDDINFGLIRNLATEVAEVLTIDPNRAMFSVILFARHAWIKFPITQYNNTDDLINAVNNIVYDDVSKLNRTGSNLPEAFDLIINNTELVLRNDSDYKSAVIVSDGRINTRNLVETQMNRTLKSSEWKEMKNIQLKDFKLAAKSLNDIFDDVLAIGIKGIKEINFEILDEIASRPEFVFEITEFTKSAFQKVIKQLSEEFCDGREIS